MNKQRRLAICEIAAKLEELKDEIQTILDEEQEYYDNIPENLQESTRAAAAEEAIENLEYSISSIEDSIENLNSSCEA